MATPAAPPKMKAFSPAMRVDVIISDWRAELLPELSAEEKERRLYGLAWEAYLEGDFGFGLWCWFECDRLANALRGNVKELTRVIGPGHFLGFPHRRALAAAVPLDRVYRPRKGDMSTPRTDAYVLPAYQLLCVYLVRAQAGDARAKAQLEIALGELEERRRADPYIRHFETFRTLLLRQTSGSPSEMASSSEPARPTSAPPTRGFSPK
ncbi:MAG: hypothetical protein WB778_08770 [Thermoplasmata archaeon]